MTAAHRIDFCPSCGFRLEVRSAEQNKRLHAILQDISTQKQWAGHWLDAEDWKRLITAAFERERKRAARIFPAIDGQGIDMIYSRTSRMSKQEMSDMIDFATSWALENEIALTDTPPLEVA